MKKNLPILYILIFYSFFALGKNNDLNPSYNKLVNDTIKSNLLSAETYNTNIINNIKIETKFEKLEIIKIFGREFSVELYGNNNKILPTITTTADSLTISSTDKLVTNGDFCTIVLYIPTGAKFKNFEIQTNDFDKKSITEINISDINAENINIKTINSSVFGRYINGNLNIYSVNGNIDLSNIFTKKSSIFTENAHISLRNVHFSQFFINSNKGNVKINNCTGEYFSLNNKIGLLSADNLTCDYFDAFNDSGTISLSLIKVPSGSSSIESSSGFVQLFLPEIENFNLFIHSTKGTFFNKLENKRFTPRYEFEKSYNEGGATISIKTFSGDIEVDSY